MDFKDIPPVLGFVVLKNGQPHFAQNMGEYVAFRNGDDYKIARSRIGEITISTVFLPCSVDLLHKDNTYRPGDEIPGLKVFETMVYGIDSEGKNVEISMKSDSVTEAVLVHLAARKNYAEANPGENMIWEDMPFCSIHHGNPEPDLKAVLQEEGGCG